jgi:hypothetical protein
MAASHALEEVVPIRFLVEQFAVRCGLATIHTIGLDHHDFASSFGPIQVSKCADSETSPAFFNVLMMPS